MEELNDENVATAEQTPSVEAGNGSIPAECDANTPDVSHEPGKTPSPDHDAEWYAKEAKKCFIDDADPDVSDVDPVKAIERVFQQRANDELKARVRDEGKTSEGAYNFLYAIANLCEHTHNGCHISPETGYAIAMHYFQDVPALAEYEPALKKIADEKRAAEFAAKAKAEAAKKAAEVEKKRAKAAKTRAKAAKTRAEAKKSQDTAAPVVGEQPTVSQQKPEKAPSSEVSDQVVLEQKPDAEEKVAAPASAPAATVSVPESTAEDAPSSSSPSEEFDLWA